MIGTVIGRFRITASLGRGGMSTVWKAEDMLLGRPVAIKLLAPELARSSDARRRFLHEARTGALLEHPGVPTIYDTGELGELVYIALTYVEGQTLAERAQRSPIEIGEGCAILTAVARILEHAHGRGVIHRDVTSRNI